VSSTHFVILAAGLGRRLAMAGYHTPKWLLEVAGRPIADRQLGGIKSVINGEPSSITVIAGHRADLVATYADAAELAVRVVVNSEFESRNNWYTLLVAFDELHLAADDRVVVINSDLCASAEWFTAVIADVLQAGTEVLAIDGERPLTSEAMKVCAKPAADSLVLEAIGKVGLKGNPCGEYVGLLTLSSQGVDVVRHELIQIAQDAARADEWYEAAIGMSASSLNWILHPVASSKWTEIDDPTDLKTAEAQI
jgi:choline kinase